MSSLLADDALPDTDSIISNAKSTAVTGTDFYQRDLTSRAYALAGVLVDDATLTAHSLTGLMAVLIIISYSSVSLSWQESGIIMGFPILILGIALSLQVAIALAGMQAVKIFTWSSSPFDLIAALVHHTQLTPASLLKPSEVQPSAWSAHRSIRNVVLSLWVLVVACAVWAAFVRCEQNTLTTSKSWSFSDWRVGYSFKYTIKSVGVLMWILAFVNLVVVQGLLTFVLHSAELVNIIQIERQWRCATTGKGLHRTNPLQAFFINPLGIFLFILKVVLRGSFAVALFDVSANARIGEPPIFITYILNLLIALLIFACVFTFATLCRPRVPQPVAYGHLQTLANLVDEWSEEMWWGHKEDGSPYCLAERSNHPLPDVKMDCLYAGSCVVSHSTHPGRSTRC
ncbi:uncharacterized protein EDB91DRAFT_1248851 [Suillus paluster]|uniref:uncharacterized protein n=1 Tax=Suillus paluster TaxID=48578 RepID=UPI001B8698AC|nr:uncharacterized protein EDB91DRAFT_1248851 [Suillus paluster]KAG1739084.1 hypothetical protein EDB91DRAFT_1248851 [Suillus paluster]